MSEKCVKGILVADAFMRIAIQPCCMFIKITFGCLFIMIFNTAFAVSFDCGKAVSSVEKLICSDNRLSSLDEQLNSAYKKAVENNSIADDIKQAQKKWMKERNICADVACIKMTYEKRLNELAPASESQVKVQLNKDAQHLTEQPGAWVHVFQDWVSEILVSADDFKPNEPIKLDTVQMVLADINIPLKLLSFGKNAANPEQQVIFYNPYPRNSESGDFPYIVYNHYRLISYVNGKNNGRDGCIYPTSNIIGSSKLDNPLFVCGVLFSKLKPEIKAKFLDCAAKHKNRDYSIDGRFFISNDQCEAKCLTSLEYEGRVNNRIKNAIGFESNISGSRAQGYASSIPFIWLDQNLFHCSDYGQPIFWQDPSIHNAPLMKKQYLIKTGGHLSCFDTTRLLDEPKEFGMYLNDGTVLLRGNVSVLRIRLSDGSTDAPSSIVRVFNEGALEKRIAEFKESPGDACEFFNCPIAEKEGWRPTPYKALRPAEEDIKLTKELFPYVIRAVDNVLLEYFESTK